MPKQTQIQRAIDSIDRDIEVLQAAKQRLVDQQKAVARKPKAAKPVAVEKQSA